MQGDGKTLDLGTGPPRRVPDRLGLKIGEQRNCKRLEVGPRREAVELQIPVLRLSEIKPIKILISYFFPSLS